jgi:hypothetical protein
MCADRAGRPHCDAAAGLEDLRRARPEAGHVEPLCSADNVISDCARGEVRFALR